LFVSSYYFYWGENEEADIAEPMDESGWVSDGALANALTNV
jgi:hypothetical protein